MNTVTCRECGQEFDHARDEICPHCHANPDQSPHRGHHSAVHRARVHWHQQILAALLVASGLVVGLMDQAMESEFPILGLAGLALVGAGLFWIIAVRLAMLRDRH